LRQVVNNLVDNAIKFTPSGGKVRVEVLADQAGVEARLCVKDTGMGIPAEELPRIFDRFYRGDKSRQRDGRSGGTGLGLSICQVIINALNGKIQVESTPGHGSQFTVSLPIVESPVTGAAAPTRRAVPTRNDSISTLEIHGSSH
jgi:two-component system phosphate regulon sensor histidine kinase PhoR